MSNGTVILPPGGVQVEVGADATTRPRQRARDAFDLTTSVRIGVTERVELRMAEGTPLRRLATDADPALAFGLKARVYETKAGSSLGIQPMLAAHPQLLRAIPAPPTIVLTFIASHEFGPRAAIDVNVAGRLDPLRVRSVAYLASASLGLQLHRRVLAFTELFVAGDPSGSLQVGPGCDAGLIVGLARWLSFDFAVRGADLGARSELVVISGLTLAWLPRSHSERLASQRRRASTSISSSRLAVRN